MDREIREAAAKASADPAVVGIIVTGAGRAFCAGADMNLLSNISSGDESSNDAGSAVAEGEAAADYSGDFDGRFPFLMTTPKPIIAAINGAEAEEHARGRRTGRTAKTTNARAGPRRAGRCCTAATRRRHRTGRTEEAHRA